MTTLCLDDAAPADGNGRPMPTRTFAFVRGAVGMRAMAMGLSPAQQDSCRRRAMDRLADGATPSAAISAGWHMASDLWKQGHP